MKFSKMEDEESERWQEGRAAKLKIITSKLESLGGGSHIRAAGMCVKTHGAGGVCVCVLWPDSLCFASFVLPDTRSSSACVQEMLSFYFYLFFPRNILKRYVSGSSAGPLPKASCLVAAELRNRPQSTVLSVQINQV